MKNVLISAAIVVAGLSMSACSHINMGNASLASKLGMKDEVVYCDPYAGVNDPCYEGPAEYDYWDTAEAQRSQVDPECLKTEEQLIIELREYEFWGGSLDGMSPEEGARFILSMC